MVIFFWLWISEIHANIFKVFQFPPSDEIFPICPAKYSAKSAKLRTSFQLSADRHNNTHIGMILDTHLQCTYVFLNVGIGLICERLARWCWSSFAGWKLYFNHSRYFQDISKISQLLIAHHRGYDSHFLSFPSWYKSNKDMIHVFISQNVIFPGRWRIFKQLSQLLVLLFQRDESSSYFNLKYERQRFPF